VRHPFLNFGLVLAVAACGTTPAPSPVGTNGSVQGVTATPATTMGPQPTEAIVAWIVDDGRPYFDLVVDSIAPRGVASPVATFHDIHPAGWVDASPRLEAPVLASAGNIVISVDRNGGGNVNDERTMILDLDHSGPAPIELPNVAEQAAWGPDGELAVFAPRPMLVDPSTGATTAMTVAPRIDLLEAWTTDGSGWLAVEDPGDHRRVGVLRRDGTFVDGRRASYGLTGRERLTGSDGQIVSVAVSDGGTTSETAIVGDGPGLCPRCVIWAKFQTPGDVPTFNDFVWDAAGTGLWITWQSADRKRGWLGHTDSPGVDRPIVDLPAGIDFDIVGISPSDAWLVLSAADQRRLVIADTLSRETRLIAQPLVPSGPPPIFAGWRSVPTR
jgi:hypothetical protein